LKSESGIKKDLWRLMEDKKRIQAAKSQRVIKTKDKLKPTPDDDLRVRGVGQATNCK